MAGQLYCFQDRSKADNFSGGEAYLLAPGLGNQREELLGHLARENGCWYKVPKLASFFKKLLFLLL